MNQLIIESVIVVFTLKKKSINLSLNTYPILRGIADEAMVGKNKIFQELKVLGRKLRPRMQKANILANHRPFYGARHFD